MIIVLPVAGIELYGAYVSKSLALGGDGVHALSDFVLYPLLLWAAVAELLSHKPQEANHRWGLVVANVLIILGILMISGAGIRMYLNPVPDIETHHMLAAAVWGLIGNFIMVMVMLGLKIDPHGHDQDENSRTPDMVHKGGFIHLVLDTLGSIIVTTSALLMHEGYVSSGLEGWAAIVIGALLIGGGIHNRKEIHEHQHTHDDDHHHHDH